MGILSRVATYEAGFLLASDILPWVDLVICHGGNGTLQQCQLFGIPALCKTYYFEQEWNIKAIEQKGRGFSLDGIRSKKKLRRIIDQWVKVVLPRIRSTQHREFLDFLKVPDRFFQTDH